jgi:hypothetical protein
MIQLYFLSILCNSLSGYILFVNNDSNNTEQKLSIINPTFQLVLGIVGTITGFLKLLSPFENRIPVFGDLIPAIAGVVAGFIMIFSAYKQNATDKDLATMGNLDRLGEALLHIKKPVGIALLAVSLLHFLFPQALFL